MIFSGQLWAQCETAEQALDLSKNRDAEVHEETGGFTEHHNHHMMSALARKPVEIPICPNNQFPNNPNSIQSKM